MFDISSIIDQKSCCVKANRLNSSVLTKKLAKNLCGRMLGEGVGDLAHDRQRSGRSQNSDSYLAGFRLRQAVVTGSRRLGAFGACDGRNLHQFGRFRADAAGVGKVYV